VYGEEQWRDRAEQVQMDYGLEYEILYFSTPKPTYLRFRDNEEENEDICPALFLHLLQEHPSSQKPPPEDDEAPQRNKEYYSLYGAKTKHDYRCGGAPHSGKKIDKGGGDAD
jgi:hypothetical protein